jgi:hypothetical protein
VSDDIPRVPPTDWSGWHPDLTLAQRDFLGDLDQLAPVGIVAALRPAQEGDGDDG